MNQDSSNEDKFWRQKYEKVRIETEQLERSFPKTGSGKRYELYGEKLMSLQGSTARINVISSSGNTPSLLDLDKPSTDLMTRQDSLMRRYIRMRKS